MTGWHLLADWSDFNDRPNHDALVLRGVTQRQTMKPDQKYAARMKAEGFVKPAIWIPADRVDELKAIAAKMREDKAKAE